MPLTGLAERREEDETARRRRLTHYVITAMVAVVVATGIQMYIMGDTRNTVDKLVPAVAQVKATQGEIQKFQGEGRVRGLRNRAVTCRGLELLGETFEPGDDCLDPALQPYFEPVP